MSKTVEFEFNVDDKVRTILDEKGVIVGLHFDETGNQYLMRTKHGEVWRKEKEIDHLGWVSPAHQEAVKAMKNIK